MLKIVFVLLCLVNVAHSACRDTYLYPFFECDTTYESMKIIQIYGRLNQEDNTKEKEEENYYKEDMAEVIVIDNLYLTHEVEVIVDPYKDLGDFDEPKVFEIDMNVLKRLRIEE